MLPLYSSFYTSFIPWLKFKTPISRFVVVQKVKFVRRNDKFRAKLITFPLDWTAGLFTLECDQWGVAIQALNQHVKPCLCKLAAAENDGWLDANRLRWARIELPQQTCAKIRSHSKSVKGRWRNTVPFTVSWQQANGANQRPVCLF